MDDSSLQDLESLRRKVVSLARVPLVLLLVWWTVAQLVRGLDWIFLDNFNWAVHEVGHFLFSFGPQWLYILGGTLFQFLFPLGLCIYFFAFRKDHFAAGVVGWWFGENMRNIARYVADAAFQELPLTGEIHDWAFLARRWHFLSTAQDIGAAIRVTGSVLMLAGLGVVLYRLWRPQDNDSWGEDD